VVQVPDPRPNVHLRQVCDVVGALTPTGARRAVSPVPTAATAR
jgi:hypothetical protein